MTLDSSEVLYCTLVQYAMLCYVTLYVYYVYIICILLLYLYYMLSVEGLRTGAGPWGGSGRWPLRGGWRSPYEIYVSLSLYTYIHIHMHIYITIHIYIYICIYIYIYIAVALQGVYNNKTMQQSYQPQCNITTATKDVIHKQETKHSIITTRTINYSYIGQGQRRS